MADAGFQGAYDRRNEMINLRETLHTPKIWRLHAPKFANLAEIVALKIRDHEQLGTLFFAQRQFTGTGGVPRRVLWESRPCALDRSRDNGATIHFQKQFGRGGEHRRAIKIQTGGMRCGRDLAQPEIKGQKIHPLRPAGPPWMGKIHLIDVTCGDVFLSPAHSSHIVFF